MIRTPRPRPWMWYALTALTLYYLMWLASEYGANRMGG